MQKQLITAALCLVISTTTVHAKNLLTINPDVLEFPATGVGSSVMSPTSALIENSGATAVTLSSLSLGGTNASDFTLSTNCPLSPATLAPGGACTANAFFVPSALGLRTARLVINDMGGSAQAVIFVGQGVAPKTAIAFYPALVSFASTAIGLPPNLSPQAYVNVTNTGTGAVSIQSLAITGAASADFILVSQDCDGTLSVGASCFAQISFVPQASGIRTANLQVSANGSGGKQSLPLTGVGSTGTNLLFVSPTTVAFTPTGTTSVEQTEIVLQNTGTGPVTVNGFLLVGPNATDFSFLEQCGSLPFVLEPGAYCFSSLMFTPSAYGTRTAQLEVVDSAEGSPQVIPLQGSGVATNLNLGIQYGSAPVNLGSTAVGATSYQDVTIQNNGLASVQISFTVDGLNAAEFPISANYCFYPLIPGTACTVTIAFSPGQAGIRVAGLKVADSISGQSQSFLMVGSGAPSGATLTGTNLGFVPEPVGTTTPIDYLYLMNQGAAPVTMGNVTVGGSASSDFHMIENGCSAGLVLNPFNSCAVVLTFDPSSVGPRVATLDVSYTGGTSPVAFPLTGTGLPTTRIIAFSPVLVNAGSQPVGQASTTTAFVENTGNSPVKFNLISIAGDDPGDFTIVENQCPSGPATLAAFASCQVSIQFTPAAVGVRKAFLQVADDATGSPQNLELLGTGNNSIASTLAFQSPLDFSVQPLGSSVGMETIVSNGNLTVSFSGIQITGPNQADFTQVNTCGAVLLPYQSCSISITFTPSVTGPRLAELQLTDTATGSPQIIPLSGFGIKASNSVALSPIPLVFPQQQAIGYTATATVTVSNTGAGDVLLSKFVISGKDSGDFGIQTNNCPLTPSPLLPNQICQLTILFAPAAPGIRIANLQVTDNAQGSPQSISLAGYAVPPTKALESNPNPVDFGSVTVGYVSYGSTLITDTGTAPVTFTGFTLAGANPADFQIPENFCLYSSPPSIMSGQGCTVYVSFTPTATGPRSAELVITSDANGEQRVMLSGTGQ